MDLRDFHKLRTAMQHSAPAGGGDELLALQQRLWCALVRSGVFTDVEVGATDDPNRLAIAMCRFSGQVTVDEAAAELERLWTDGLRYDLWEAHTVIISRGQVELEAVTRKAIPGHYVTLHVLAQQSVIPAQRVPWPAQRSTLVPTR
jgi:hypothetical protein